jgi:hypothetical protein
MSMHRLAYVHDLTSFLMPFALQATRQVARAIEWYGPDRPKWLGELHMTDALFLVLCVCSS